MGELFRQVQGDGALKKPAPAQGAATRKMAEAKKGRRAGSVEGDQGQEVNGRGIDEGG
jgi:hypothetical protein